jgi:acetyl-CoA carboxylase biotin carboxyl carrier protein
MREHEIRRLIELVEQSQIDELEVRRWWNAVRIAKVRRGSNGRGDHGAAPFFAAGHVAGGPYELDPMASGGPAAGTAAPASAAMAPPGAAGAAGAGDSVHAHQAGLIAIVSPMVGTFYAAPSPTAPAYVQVGSRVSSGQVVCIIEAMKLMNEIEAEISGTIAEILVQNEQPVEFNPPLFLVRPGA